MRIGIDIRTAGGNKVGKGWFTFNIARTLLKLDKENQYILYASGGIAGFEEFDNAELRIVEQKGILWHRTVAKDITQSDIDIFYAPSSYIIPALLSKKSGTKIFFTVHDLVAFLFKGSGNIKARLTEKLFIKRALKRAEKITVISENTKKDLMDLLKVPEEKIVTTLCAADDHYFPIPESEENIKALRAFRLKTGLPEKFFLSVGTIEPRKNYETLLKAFALINKSHPDTHLVIVGKEGWGDSKQAVEEIITSNYLQKYVHILGYLTNKTINKLYNLSQALVFPSYYEGFGLPPLEAMQAGCPVIASNTSSIPEVVGEAAILCDPENPSSFAQAMDDISTNPNLRTDLINKGRIQSKKFNWEDIAKVILREFKS